MSMHVQRHGRILTTVFPTPSLPFQLKLKYKATNKTNNSGLGGELQKELGGGEKLQKVQKL